MIEQKERSIIVPNWGHRQYESDNVTARTRDHRERSKEQDRNVPKNVRRNTPETETETEEEKSSGSRKRGTTGTRLGEGWIPSDSVRQQMGSERPDVDLKAEHLKFVDHWRSQPGAKGRKLDWDATWRNWIRNARGSQAQQRRLEPVVEYRDEPAPDPASLPWLREEGA